MCTNRHVQTFQLVGRRCTSAETLVLRFHLLLLSSSALCFYFCTVHWTPLVYEMHYFKQTCLALPCFGQYAKKKSCSDHSHAPWMSCAVTRTPMSVLYSRHLFQCGAHVPGGTLAQKSPWCHWDSAPALHHHWNTHCPGVWHTLYLGQQRRYSMAMITKHQLSDLETNQNRLQM